MRTVITGHDAEGRSVVVADGIPPRTRHSSGWPGFISSVGWATEASVPVSRTGEDPTDEVETPISAPGSTRLILLALPPDATMVGPDFDGATYGAAGHPFTRAGRDPRGRRHAHHADHRLHHRHQG